MIVRCKNCNSAFAVDDDKVSGKKFAFSCLKCDTENIIDNRTSENSEDSIKHSIPDIEQGIGDDLSDTIQDSNEYTPSDDDIFAEDTDFDTDFDSDIDSIEDTDSHEKADDSDLFTDDEILSFEDDAELEIQTGDEISEDDIIFDEPETSGLSEKKSSRDDEPKLKRQEDIDELFASIPDSGNETTGDDSTSVNLDEIELEFEDTDLSGDDISFDENSSIGEAGDISEEDIDIDLADLEIEDNESVEADGDNAGDKGIALDFDEDDKLPETEEDLNLDLDLDELDMDMETDENDMESEISDLPDIDLEESSLSEEESELSLNEEIADEDEDLTLNLDELDIDLDESPSEEEAEQSIHEEIADEDEDLTLNLDELDIDLDEEIPAEKEAESSHQDIEEDEEDLTLNLDELDIDIDEIPLSGDKPEALHDEFTDADADEDLTLNLNELDIELEDEVIKSSLEDINRSDSALPEDEDESITIDLDTLDIDVTEGEENVFQEDFEEEEKLTLDDAGITFDELAEEDEKAPEYSDTGADDFLSPDLSPDDELSSIADNSTPHERPVVDTLDELPEIDLDEYEDYLTRDEAPDAETAAYSPEKNDINFDDIEIIPLDDDLDIYTSEEDYSEESIPGRGTTSLSIDFSLKYSRLGALLRLTGLYMISLLPHFAVLILYTAVSAVLGFINQMVILFTGHCLEDFSQITENTLRYLVSIKTNITGIVEDRPVFSGRENLSHQLQMNITYPVKYSKNIAILRLSVLGIILFTLPHLAILMLLTLTVPFVVIAGLIIVAATGRWPGVLFRYLTKYFRYLTRLMAFTIGLNDEYPPFRLE